MRTAKALTLTPIVTNMWGPIVHRLYRLHHAVIRLEHLDLRLEHWVDAVLHALVLDEIVVPGEHPVAPLYVAGDIADGVLCVVCSGQGVNCVVHDGFRFPRLCTDAVFLDAARINCAREAEVLGADVVLEINLGDEVFSAGI